jgi:hypothetical protein
MNIAEKEFLETGIEWGNASLSRIAKEHGGAKELIEDIYENGYIDGREDAKKSDIIQQDVIVGVATITITGLVFLVTRLSKKMKVKQKIIDRQIEENIRLKAESYAENMLGEGHIQDSSGESGMVVPIVINRKV